MVCNVLGWSGSEQNPQYWKAAAGAQKMNLITTRAKILSFVAISVASSWEDTVWTTVLKNQVWPVSMEQITDTWAAEVMKLMVLKSEILSVLTGLSQYCVYCVCSDLRVDYGHLWRWLSGSAETEVLNHPRFSVCPVVAGCKLQADSNGSYDTC